MDGTVVARCHGLRHSIVKEFTGVSDPYEQPADAEVEIHTEGRSPEESAQLVLAKLDELDLLPDEVLA